MQLPIDEKTLYYSKSEVVSEINAELLKQKNRGKTCRICGHIISAFSKFNICDDCYHKQCTGDDFYKKNTVKTDNRTNRTTHSNHNANHYKKKSGVYARKHKRK